MAEGAPLNIQACDDPLPQDDSGLFNLGVVHTTTGMFGFGNAEIIKEKVRKAKLKKEAYNVHDRYHKSGIFQAIARNPKFENTTLGIIVLNAIWIWIDTDFNKSDSLLDADAVFVAADSMFFGYFAFELITRFMAFKRKCDCMKDAWFVFDSILVGLYAFDPFTIALIIHIQGGELDLPTAVLRLFRLARLSRLVRMLRSLPELMIMIKGMITALASVVYALALLILITYIFAIALVNLKSDVEDGEEGGFEDMDGNDVTASGHFFETVLEAMHNLIVYATFCDDLSDFIMGVKDDNTACFVLCWAYISLSALTVMNMLIGVLCEVISAVAEEEKESMMCDKVHEKFSALVKELDTNNDGNLSWSEFQAILENQEALKALESVNVDPESMVDMAEDFFYEDGEPITISFSEFMEMILDLRGGQIATVRHAMSLGKRFGQKFTGHKARMDNLEKKIDNINDKFDAIYEHLEIPPIVVHDNTEYWTKKSTTQLLASLETSTSFKKD